MFNEDENIKTLMMKATLPSFNPGVQDVRMFPCQTCGRSYKWRQSLDRHIKHECGKDPNFFCPHCSFQAKHKTSLQRHFMTIHMPLIRVQQEMIIKQNNQIQLKSPPQS